MNRRMKFSVATVVGVSGAVLGPGVQAVGIGFPPADQAPTAIIRVPQYLGVAPLAVVLDGSASSDAEGAIVSYEWRVDGRRLDGASVRWRFEELGEYDVVLTVRDDSGQAASAEAVVTVAGGPWTPRSEVTEPEARRFLWQAAWGAHPDDVDFVMEHGFEAWIEAQEQTPATYYDDASMDELADLLRDETIEEVSEEIAERRANGEDLGDLAEFLEPEFLEQFEVEGEPLIFEIFDDLCVASPDQLRQRTAWALLQIVPLRPNFESGFVREYADIYNSYLRAAMHDEREENASGNYYDFLLEMTYSGAMGDWLTYKGNAREDAATGVSPDENYAREIMQLFTVGLVELNPDGTERLSDEGEPISTFNNHDVAQLARVFTGLVDQNPYAFEAIEEPEPTPFPMRIDPGRHEAGAKTLLDYPGASVVNIPVAQQARRSGVAVGIEAALTNLFEHPNHGPFLATRMIKRFTTSNPTPAYVGRVAEAYEGRGPYGRGERGDVGTMVRAILLDDEARNPAYRSNPMYGRVLEPMQVLLGTARSFGAIADSEPAGRMVWLEAGWSMQETTGQGFYLTPSVFNYYDPSYAPVGSAIATGGMTAPELQIFDDFTSVAGLRGVTDQLAHALHDARPDFVESLERRAGRPRTLALVLASKLDHGWASDRNIALLGRAIGRVPEDEERLYAALLLTLGHPAFRVLR